MPGRAIKALGAAASPRLSRGRWRRPLAAAMRALVVLVVVLVVLVVLVVALGLPARGLGPGGAVPGQPRSPAQRRRQAPQSARAYSIPIAGTPRTVRLRQQ